LSAENPAQGNALYPLGIGLLETNLDKAIDLIGRSVSASERMRPARPEVVAKRRFALVKALWRIRSRRDEAREHARKAEAEFASVEEVEGVSQEDLETVRAWIARHG
jgi:hypothetical protein